MGCWSSRALLVFSHEHEANAQYILPVVVRGNRETSYSIWHLRGQTFLKKNSSKLLSDSKSLGWCNRTWQTMRKSLLLNIAPWTCMLWFTCNRKHTYDTLCKQTDLHQGRKMKCGKWKLSVFSPWVTVHLQASEIWFHLFLSLSVIFHLDWMNKEK